VRKQTLVSLAKQAKPYFEQFTLINTLENILASIDFVIKEDEINELYKKIYKNVGQPFAVGSAALMKTGKYTIETKQDDFLETQWSLDIQTYIEGEAANLVTAVTDTTKNFLATETQKAIEQGLSIPNAAKEITNRFDFISRYRSEVIARTEIVRASNYGSLWGAQSTGLDMDKVWLSARDKRTRPDHLDADGQRKKINEYFVLKDGSRLKYPGDPSAPGKQTIQCRCTQIYLQSGQQSVF
jgi:hypothetical protein